MTWLVPPARGPERARALARSFLCMAGIELTIRRRDVLTLCRTAGIDFLGFDAAVPAATPLSIDVAHKWWATEAVLRRWPWGRQRQCLRRSLLLGRLLRYRDPALCLEVRRLQPLDMHAWLLVSGHRIDMGDAGPMVTTMQQAQA